MSAMPTPPGAAGAAATARIGRTRPALRHVSLVLGGLLTAAFVVTALISRVYLPHDIDTVAPADRLLSAGSSGYLFGSDHLGRDIASQLMAGAWTSLTVSLSGTLAAALIGVTAGLLSASTRGFVDDGIMRVSDLLLAFPGVVFALVLAATVGSGWRSTVIALTVFFAPSFMRVTRASALRVLEEDYITAARIYGRRKPYVLVRHVLPNISGVLIVQITIFFAVGILVEASLSYLGAGITRPDVSFGLMLQEAQQNVGASGVLALWPGLAIVVAALGLNLLGDGLRDVLDPTLSRGRR